MGYEMLELYEAKVSCTVLRGERRSNPPDLPDDCGTTRPSIHSECPYSNVHFCNGSMQSLEDNEV